MDFVSWLMWTRQCKFYFETLTSVILYLCPEVALVDQMVILCFVVLKTFHLSHSKCNDMSLLVMPEFNSSMSTLTTVTFLLGLYMNIIDTVSHARECKASKWSVAGLWELSFVTWYFPSGILEERLTMWKAMSSGRLPYFFYCSRSRKKPWVPGNEWMLNWFRISSLGTRQW